MAQNRTTLLLAEAAWLYQVSEDALYRRCRRGRVAYAYQVGVTWHFPVVGLRRHLPRLAGELAHALANGEIAIARGVSRYAPPKPLTVYRWMSDSDSFSDPCPQGDGETCIHEFDTAAHLRTRTTGEGRC